MGTNSIRKIDLRTIMRNLATKLILIIILLVPYSVLSQALDCEVIVNFDQISSANTNYLENLEPAISDYINKHKWTDDKFLEHERIQCSIQFDLTSIDDNANLSGSLVVSIRRPIYGTTKQTTIVQLRDNSWTMNYPINKTLVHDRQQFDTVTSLLDYYAYIILGFDYDTFAELGGTPYFEKAQDVVDVAQTGSSTGWQRNSGTNRDNRFFLASFMLSSAYTDLRKIYYQYHRHGLDKFLRNQEQTRQLILDQLEILQEVQRQTTDQFMFRNFFDAKYQEIIAIFRDAPSSTRVKAHTLLTDIDQSHISTYDRELMN